ncbi:hypothetical protein BU16DRAFT_532425 [Lophium mytilinum]|uniref:Uncharacterized protein n=1 Tax=Lophium mytilinum TaxID=390894 RepID=A0A6A6REW9_9PEZI|nr:hypothetical protein BU16DRAFT_532425 [Lophium mytilinum]
MASFISFFNPSPRDDFAGPFKFSPFHKDNVLDLVKQVGVNGGKLQSTDIPQAEPTVLAIHAANYFTNGLDLIGILWRTGSDGTGHYEFQWAGALDNEAVDVWQIPYQVIYEIKRDGKVRNPPDGLLAWRLTEPMVEQLLGPENIGKESTEWRIWNSQLNFYFKMRFPVDLEEGFPEGVELATFCAVPCVRVYIEPPAVLNSIMASSYSFPMPKTDFPGSFQFGPFDDFNVMKLIRDAGDSEEDISFGLDEIPKSTSLVVLYASNYFTNGQDLVGILWRGGLLNSGHYELQWVGAIDDQTAMGWALPCNEESAIAPDGGRVGDPPDGTLVWGEDLEDDANELNEWQLWHTALGGYCNRKREGR